MRWNSKTGRRVALGAGVVVALLAICVVWLLPAVISSKIRQAYGGRVEFSGWWIDSQSAGLKGLRLSESDASDSPRWLTVGRISTDLTLLGLLRGRATPRRVELEGVEVALRLNADGSIATPIPIEPPKKGGPLPEILIRGATLSLSQRDRPTFHLSGLDGRLDAGKLELTNAEPDWARLRVEGKFAEDFSAGQVVITTASDARATPERLRGLPFVPPEVWQHVLVTGPVGLAIDLQFDRSASPPIRSLVTVDLHATESLLPSVGLSGSETTGRVVVDAPHVKVEHLASKSLGGTIDADGAIELDGAGPRLNLQLKMAGIQVADAPRTWQLDEIGATGRLSGRVRLIAKVLPDGVDLSGSSGNAVVEGGTLQGFPVKSLRLSMRGEGSDIRYDSDGEPKGASFTPNIGAPWLAALLVTLQEPAPKRAAPPLIQLPKSLTTQVEFEDLDLAEVVARLESLTPIRVPVRMAGRASLKARATIPIGALKDIKAYGFHGQAKLLGATIDGVDLGRVDATLDLENGVVKLSDFRGQLIDRPAGHEADPPRPTEALPKTGNLPLGGFRGDVSAEISPPGRLKAKFAAETLPLGELAAPFLPRPTPLSGSVTLDLDAGADVAKLGEAGAWTVSGRLRSRQIVYREAKLDEIFTLYRVADGRLKLNEFSALLADNPLNADLTLALSGAREFKGRVGIQNWDLAQILPFLPDFPSPSPVQALLTATADVTGTATPLSIRSNGEAKLGRITVQGVNLGDLPLQWKTEGDDLAIRTVDAHLLGGTLVADGRLPTVADRPATLSAKLTDVDTAAITKAIPGAAKFSLSGKAEGDLSLKFDPKTSQLSGSVQIRAPKMTVQGVDVGKIAFDLKSDAGKLVYTASADSASGKTRFDGSVPFPSLPLKLTAPADAKALAVGYTLGDLARLSGLGAVPANLRGVVGLDANLRVGVAPDFPLGVHGILEARGLKWGDDFPLGWLRGVVARNPEMWDVREITGELVGGRASGAVWTAQEPGRPRFLRFDLGVDRAPLANLFAFAPDLARQVSGFGSLRLDGRYDQALTARADINVGRATAFGLPFSEVRLPVEVAVDADGANGVVRVRQLAARASGGSVRGEASMRLGGSDAFNVVLDLTNIDVETIARSQTLSARPGSGRASGRVTLSGPSPKQPKQYRGRVDLDLDDASLVELPVVRELGRFLGSAQGGLIEDGDLHGTIANRQLTIESLTLEGRLVQLHITGTVGFDGAVALEALASTNSIFPQTGAALLNNIPGLSEVLGQGEQTVLRLSNFFSNRLLKFRITGTVKNPQVRVDPAVAVTTSAVGFFSGVLKLPLGALR